MFFATEAFAQTAAAPMDQQSIVANLIPLVLIFVVFYILMVRPHQKRMKEHQLMMDNLRRGDKVLTGGGIIGTVSKIEGDIIVVEIAPEIKVKVSKPTITQVLTKTGVSEISAAEITEKDKKGKAVKKNVPANDVSLAEEKAE